MNAYRGIDLIVALAVYVGAGSNPVSAQSFAEDFEGGLGQWVGKNGGAHHAEIVVDPLRPENRVVRFAQTAAGGDIFGPELSVPAGHSVAPSFEYLGLPRSGSQPDDFGGFIGYARDLLPQVDCSQSSNPNHWDNVWLGGTAADYCNLRIHLLDDGQWRVHELRLTPVFSPIRLMLEDCHGVARDAYFDNLAIVVVCPGDMDCDGVIGFEDINPFVAILGGARPCSVYNADVNADGQIDFEDINPFVDLLANQSGPCR